VPNIFLDIQNFDSGLKKGSSVNLGKRNIKHPKDLDLGKHKIQKLEIARADVN